MRLISGMYILSSLENYYLNIGKSTPEEAKIKTAIYAIACLSPDFFGESQLKKIEEMGLELPLEKIEKKFDENFVIEDSHINLRNTLGYQLLNQMDFNRRWAIYRINPQCGKEQSLDVVYIKYLTDAKQFLSYIKNAFKQDDIANIQLTSLNIFAEAKRIVEIAQRALESVEATLRSIKNVMDPQVRNEVQKVISTSGYIAFPSVGAAFGTLMGGLIGAAVGSCAGMTLAFSLSELTKFSLSSTLPSPSSIKHYSIFSTRSSKSFEGDNPLVNVLSEIKTTMEKRK